MYDLYTENLLEFPRYRELNEELTLFSSRSLTTECHEQPVVLRDTSKFFMSIESRYNPKDLVLDHLTPGPSMNVKKFTGIY